MGLSCSQDDYETVVLGINYYDGYYHIKHEYGYWLLDKNHKNIVALYSMLKVGHACCFTLDGDIIVDIKKAHTYVVRGEVTAILDISQEMKESLYSELVIKDLKCDYRLLISTTLIPQITVGQHYEICYVQWHRESLRRIVKMTPLK